MTTREEIAAIRAKQDEEYALADAVQEKVGESTWNAILAFNTYLSIRTGQTFEFFRRENGTADYRLRQLTSEELREHYDGRAEDLL